MSCLCKCILAAKLFCSETQNSNIEAKEQVVVYRGKYFQVVVPERPLAAQSVVIQSNESLEGKKSTLSAWSADQHAEMYDLAQKIVKIWKDSHLSQNYMIYGKEDVKSASGFRWEIVPYPSSGWALWHQLKVLWKIIFGADAVNAKQRREEAKQYEKYTQYFSEPWVSLDAQSLTEKSHFTDPFCNPTVLDKQRIFEGKKVNVLYNYAPVTIGEGKLHFLLTPKEHREKFSDLTPDEYLEISAQRSKLLNHYQKHGYEVAYIFNKTGAPAGQTVPHFHEHVILTASKMQEFIGKLRVLKNMLFGSSKLSEDELKQKVADLKQELTPMLLTQ